MRYLILSALLTFLPVAHAGDTCLGEWTEQEETYCEGLMTYVRAIIADRNVDRPKAEVFAEINEARNTFAIPRQLAVNYINLIYLYDEPKNRAIVPPLMDGCINNYNVIMEALETEDLESF